LTWANEKTLILNFPELIPSTLVSGHADRLREFVHKHQKAVIKPLDGNGGRGVLILDVQDKNLNALIDLSLAPGVPVMIQAFVKEVVQGDRRVILIDGEPAGVLNRVAGPTDHRCNMHVGARADWVPLSDVDRSICAVIGPFLKRHGMVFTGIDIIGDRLTEINVTSPTGVEEIKAAGGPDLAAMTIKLLVDH
jgi:glutathione synthase